MYPPYHCTALHASVWRNSLFTGFIFLWIQCINLKILLPPLPQDFQPPYSIIPFICSTRSLMYVRRNYGPGGLCIMLCLFICFVLLTTTQVGCSLVLLHVCIRCMLSVLKPLLVVLNLRPQSTYAVSTLLGWKSCDGEVQLFMFSLSGLEFKLSSGWS